MDPDDFYDEDIGEYDEQPIAPSKRASALPPPSVPLSSFVALSTPSVLIASPAVAKAKRASGWADVDAGALSIAEMDRRLEEEKRQSDAQRLAEERARQWSQGNMHERVVSMKARDAGRELLHAQTMYNARMAQQHVGLGRHMGGGSGQRKAGPAATRATAAGAGRGRKAGELIVGAITRRSARGRCEADRCSPLPSPTLPSPPFHAAALSVCADSGPRRRCCSCTASSCTSPRIACTPVASHALSRLVLANMRIAVLLHPSVQSSTLLDGSPRDELPAKLRISAAAIALDSGAKESQSSQPPPSSSSRASHPPGFPAAPSVVPPTPPLPSVVTAPPTRLASASRPLSTPALPAGGATLLLEEDTPALRKERARLDKTEQQRLKAERKADKKEAKQARREQKKADKEALEQQRQREERKADAEEETKPPSARDARVHALSPSPSPSAIVDELSSFLHSTAAELDGDFDRLLLRAIKAPTSSSAPRAHEMDASLSAVALSSADAGDSGRIDYAKLDAAVLPAPAPTAMPEEEVARVSDRQREEEEDADYRAWQLQQEADLHVDEDGEYQPIGGDDGEALRPPLPDEAAASPTDDVPENWDDDPTPVAAADEDAKAAVQLRSAAGAGADELDLDGLDLRDLTEDEIIAAYMEQFQALEDEAREAQRNHCDRDEGEAGDDDGESEGDGLVHDVSNAHLASSVRPRLLSGDEDEVTEARAEERVKRRAQDAANGILDWTGYEGWSSDEEEEEEEEEDEDDEEKAEDEEDLSASDEHKDEWEYDSDDSGFKAQRGGRGASVASPSASPPSPSCRCFVPGSKEDPSHVAKQLQGFFLSPVSAQCTLRLAEHRRR